MTQRWPNFFVVGAARSGTTALFHLLRQHPDIFLPHQKEPHYFALAGRPAAFRGPGANRGINRKAVADTEAYLRLFAGVRSERAVGEASVSYLYYRGVAERIRDLLGTVKILVVLRDPAERAFSNFQFLRSVAREPLDSFRDGLEAEDERRRDGWEHIWFYRGLGLYHRQLARFVRVFGRDHIHAMRYEALRSDPVGVVQEAFRFLGVDPSVRVAADFEVNVSGEPRSHGLASLLLRPSWLIRILRPVVPRPIRLPLETAVRKRLLRSASLPDGIAAELRDSFRADLGRLEALLGWDLSTWSADRR